MLITVSAYEQQYADGYEGDSVIDNREEMGNNHVIHSECSDYTR